MPVSFYINDLNYVSLTLDSNCRCHTDSLSLGGRDACLESPLSSSFLVWCKRQGPPPPLNACHQAHLFAGASFFPVLLAHDAACGLCSPVPAVAWGLWDSKAGRVQARLHTPLFSTTSKAKQNCVLSAIQFSITPLP